MFDKKIIITCNETTIEMLKKLCEKYQRKQADCIRYLIYKDFTDSNFEIKDFKD